MNIVFRNEYHALKNIYLIREYFEKTKEYKEWWDKVKKDHPEWTSWDYGLSISWDNNPGKDKTGESAPETPTDLVGSESTPEDPKRQEP